MFGVAFEWVHVMRLLSIVDWRIMWAAVFQVNDATVQDGFTSAAFHPDGLILGTGTAESLVRIWDVKSQVSVDPYVEFEGCLVDLSAFSRVVWKIKCSADWRGEATIMSAYLLMDRGALRKVTCSGSVASKIRSCCCIVCVQSNVAKFEGHSGPVTDISFSENGYFLAVSGNCRSCVWLF